MRAAAELSLYPLADDYLTPICDVIARLNAIDGLEVVTNAMSTQVVGDYDVLMPALTREVRTSFEQHGKCVFVMKLLHLS